MASRYRFSKEEIEQIVATRKANKDKRAEARLKASNLGPEVNNPRMWRK